MTIDDLLKTHPDGLHDKLIFEKAVCMYDNNNDTLSRGWGVFNKGLYGEAQPRGPTPYPFIYHFLTVRKSIFNPFVYLL